MKFNVLCTGQKSCLKSLTISVKTSYASNFESGSTFLHSKIDNTRSQN